MANLLSGGQHEFNASVWGLPHPSTLDFIQRQLDTATDTLTAAGQQFMAGAHEIYERFNGSHALRLMRAASRAASHFWQSNVIRYLPDIGAMQQAPFIMHRWIMAEPTVRQLYHDQRCDGYSHAYVDMHANDIGEQHYDYRRVMSGVAVIDEETGSWRARTYVDELLPDDHDLSMEEKSEILDTWWSIREMLKSKREDPTSMFNGDLE